MFLALLALGIAVQPRKPAVQTRFSKKIILPKDYKNSFGCDMCTKVVQYIEQLLKDQTVESEIATLVERLCTTFGSPYDSLCKTVIDSYLPTILEWLEKDLEALDICTKIGLCSTTSSLRKISLPKNYQNGIGCDMCTKVVQYIEQLLKDQTVESEIATLVERLCTTFGSPYDSLCKTVIDSYLPTILEWLEKDLEALDICTKIGLCTSQNLRVSKHKSNSSCDVCKSWFQWAEDNLQNVTVDALWKLVSEECPKVPYLKYFCQTINEQNIEAFVSLILSNLPPEQCCSWIKLC